MFAPEHCLLHDETLGRSVWRIADSIINALEADRVKDESLPKPLA